MPTIAHINLLASSTLASADAWAALPQWVLVGAGIVGVVLWLFGHATLKFGFGVIGLLAGALAGYVMPGLLGAGVHPGIPAALGAIVGLMAGLISFRFSVALIQGVVLGVIAALLVFIVVAPMQARELKDQVGTAAPAASSDGAPARGLELEVRAVAEDSQIDAEPGTGEPTTGTLDEVRESLTQQGADPAVDFALRSAEDLRDSTQRLADTVRPMWNDLPREHRTGIALAAIGAATVGLGLGLFFPKRSSAGVTALAGSMLWVPALMELMARGAVRPPGIDVHDTWTRMACVGVIAVIGTCIQWAMTRRGADKA
ncbi:MAG: hypothetical protein ACKVZJ_06960 [Phycisphaerales bacterium]